MKLSKNSRQLGLVFIASTSAVVGLLLHIGVAQAERLMDSSGKVVRSGSGECIEVVGENTKVLPECGDAVRITPYASLEAVVTDTAASVTEQVMEKITIAASMLFDFDSAELSDDAKLIIDERIQALGGRAQLTSIMRIEGHTDSIGPAAYNQVLSEQRAKAVGDYIVSKSYNVNTSDIQLIGLGETQPVASNDSAEGRAQNRRVDIIAEGQVRR